MRPVLLDLFCGAGGAAKGYHDAGFSVVGVDLAPQPRYPYSFTQDNALAFLDSLIMVQRRRGFRLRFDAIHASPPCQAFTKAQRLQANAHPDLVGPTRDRLQALGLPYVIENVPGAPLVDPVVLCGTMFDLRLYRHRLFETSFDLPAPEHPKHTRPQVKMGRKPKPHEMLQPVGNFSGVAEAREAMGMPWATRNELREAIPPAYTEYVGKHLWNHLQRRTP